MNAPTPVRPDAWRTIRRLALATSLATWVLLLVGATVSMMGAGLACPDWPLCHGRLIPPMDRLVMIEYGHRLLASAVGFMMVALVVMVWRRRAAPGGDAGLSRLGVAMLVLLFGQVLLGGATVLSLLVPVIVGTHLLAAVTFFTLLAVFTARAHWAAGAAAPPAPPPGLSRTVHVALVLAFLQVALGGYTSAFGAGLACPDFPLCRGRLFPSPDPLVLLHYTHRLVALALTIAVAALAGRARRAADRATRVAAAAAAVLVIAQVVLGAFTVWTGIASAVRVAHLGGAGALMAALAVLLVRVRLAPASAAPDGAPAAGLRAVVADYVALTKPRIIVLLLVTTITTMVVAAGGMVAWTLAVYTLLGGALAAGAANAINCYWDRDVDAVMHRTRRRPLPARRVAPAAALGFGAALAAASVALLGMLVNWLAAALAFAGIVYYVGVYTIWLKRTTPQNIVIGGAAGAVPPLVGWAAVTGDVGLPAVLLFLIIFLWTPPHFWALALYRADDYRAARIPMLPIVRGTAATLRHMVGYTGALIAATLLLGAYGGLGRVYLVAAVVLAVPLAALVGRLVRQTTAGGAQALFRYSIVYLGLLFAAMAVDRLVG